MNEYYVKFKEVVKPKLEPLSPEEWKKEIKKVAEGAFELYMESATQLISLMNNEERDAFKVDMMHFQATTTINITNHIKGIVEGAINGQEGNSLEQSEH